MKRALIIAVSSLLLAACQKLDDGNATQDSPAPESVGTYIYDGTEYPVHTAVNISNGNTLMVMISPLGEDDPKTTYAIIGINPSLEGKEIDVETAWNNDDYYFRYEDPVKYYSEYRKLRSGTICIKRTGGTDDTFRIKADVILPDGTDFRFEYSGKIASATL